MYHVHGMPRAAEENLLVPMLDDSVCRIDYSSVHIKKDTGEIVAFWPAREGWVVL